MPKTRNRRVHRKKTRALTKRRRRGGVLFGKKPAVPRPGSVAAQQDAAKKAEEAKKPYDGWAEHEHRLNEEAHGIFR